jgi:hypothetical protein
MSGVENDILETRSLETFNCFEMCLGVGGV